MITVRSLLRKPVICSICKSSYRFVAQASAWSKERHQDEHNWVHPYHNLYPWRSLTEFTDVLRNNIVYEDDKFVAINKPWGVGFHVASFVPDKKKGYHLLNETFGNPKFCIHDALRPLAEHLKSEELFIAKSNDKYQSGILLLAKEKRLVDHVRLNSPRMQHQNIPHYTYWCICKGYPSNNQIHSEERVGVKLSEIDELGDYKEPEILFSYSKGSLKRQDVKPALVHMKVLKTNKELSVSLIEFKTSLTKWNFVQCYAAMKTTFILGDVRFAKRVRHLLGVPILLSPHNINAYDNFEPLPLRIRNHLQVPKNSTIPLLLHLKGFTLGRSRKIPEIQLDTPELPPYFHWSMKKLGLLSNDNHE
ncbi:hypothetical protein HDE_10596 [Halotydeus destructor]|nr:hypothetical protein HDE_10596 [Halotydeus destructor]